MKAAGIATSAPPLILHETQKLEEEEEDGRQPGCFALLLHYPSPAWRPRTAALQPTSRWICLPWLNLL